MAFISAQEAAKKWDISKRRVQTLCAGGRIENAARVGNMWLIPSDINKPYDARLKVQADIIKSITPNPIRVTRNEIRAMVSRYVRELSSVCGCFEELKISILSSFACGVLSSVMDFDEECPDRDLIRSYVRGVLGAGTSGSDAERKIEEDVRIFFNGKSSYVDDAFGWCYQFLNRHGEPSSLAQTQFFTEKYMITTLVDNIGLRKEDTVFDPACGGGNFLLYCYDMLASESYEQIDSYSSCLRIMQGILDRLRGYDIDPVLAKVAAMSLIIKSASLAAGLGYGIRLDDLLGLSARIYSPASDTIGGSLDFARKDCLIINSISGETASSGAVFGGCSVILTNPPFQTVKGMPDALKGYLREEYPLVKCDMCNAFISFAASILPEAGRAGMVTQNSWMYLESFEILRRNLLETVSIDFVWELGSNAFYDLSGEKSNVALVCFRKAKPADNSEIRLYSMKSLPQNEMEDILSDDSLPSLYEKRISQAGILMNEGARLDAVSSDRLRILMSDSSKYGSHAVPMQGTSTGDAKNLIDYFWNHPDDSDWVPVSKGGGYSRWRGLNSYSVKWGENGEFIRDTKGFALRNAGYFKDTQMVFSDTGTSGLNVRELLPGQIFVASGPGIRITDGKKFAHLAFLNSRLASYYIRLISPKLTIAAGYISKLPVCGEILDSDYLDWLGRRCVLLKTDRLQKRPCNLEFKYFTHDGSVPLSDAVYEWFKEDMEDEWEQLRNEELIENFISRAIGLSDRDSDVIDGFVGVKRIYDADDKAPAPVSETIGHMAARMLDSNCELNRTKSGKSNLGCDGLLEFISQKYGCACEKAYKAIMQPDAYSGTLKNMYTDLYLHALTMSVMDYRHPAGTPVAACDIVSMSGITDKADTLFYSGWIDNRFNAVHEASMFSAPIYRLENGLVHYLRAGNLNDCR
ncbi:MAG: N-6 DNA methylase [Clostridia bacterium]|nr:N-6 DNA methylase [Clostridia bacterium]